MSLDAAQRESSGTDWYRTCKPAPGLAGLSNRPEHDGVHAFFAGLDQPHATVHDLRFIERRLGGSADRRDDLEVRKLLRQVNRLREGGVRRRIKRSQFSFFSSASIFLRAASGSDILTSGLLISFWNCRPRIEVIPIFMPPASTIRLRSVIFESVANRSTLADTKGLGAPARWRQLPRPRWREASVRRTRAMAS